MSDGFQALAAWLLKPEPWMRFAACKDKNPSMFILDQGYTAAEAKKVCSKCSCVQACLQYARRTGSVGVWGGKVFTFRSEEPDYVEPVYEIQDARPQRVSINLGGTWRRTSGITGQVASNYRAPGILGGS